MDSEDMEYAHNYMELLKRQANNQFFDTNLQLKPNYGSIRSYGYYSAYTFKKLICELFYHAVQMFPEIKEYIIECSNGNNKSTIRIGFFDQLDDEGETALVIINNKDSEYILNKTDINNFYVANRTTYCNHDVINYIMDFIYMDAQEPTIKTKIIPAPAKSDFRKPKNYFTKQ